MPTQRKRKPRPPITEAHVRKYLDAPDQFPEAFDAAKPFGAYLIFIQTWERHKGNGRQYEVGASLVDLPAAARLIAFAKRNKTTVADVCELALGMRDEWIVGVDHVLPAVMAAGTRQRLSKRIADERAGAGSRVDDHCPERQGCEVFRNWRAIGENEGDNGAPTCGGNGVIFPATGPPRQCEKFVNDRGREELAEELAEEFPL